MMGVTRTRMLACVIATCFVVVACATTTDKHEVVEHRVAGNEPWRETRPVAGTPAPVVFPAFQRAEMKNGLTLVVLEDHALPTVHAAVVVRAGTAMDGRDPGVASLAWDLLDEGTGDYNSTGLANAFGDLGATVTSEASREYGRISVTVLRTELDRGLELMSQIAQRPAFMAADFERLKKLHVASLKGKEGDPDTLGWQLLMAEVFGFDHPYGHPADGTVATVDKLRLAAVKRFWSEFAGPKNAAVIFVGDITLDDAKALVEKQFGKWRGGPAKPPRAPVAPKAKKGTRVVVVDFPGAPQTMIRVGRPLMAAADPELASAIVMNQVLGGMFTSRLNLKLREEKQWTYGAYSSVDARHGVGPFFIGTDVQSDKTGDALAELFVQLDTLRSGGITEDELALAKANYLHSLPGLFAVAPLQIAEAAWLFALGLPTDHHQKLAADVEAVTADQAKAAVDRAIVKDDMVVVLIGDRATIEAGLVGKNLGEVVFVGRDGQPAK